jgi:hypothetical protein
MSKHVASKSSGHLPDPEALQTRGRWLDSDASHRLLAARELQLVSAEVSALAQSPELAKGI